MRGLKMLGLFVALAGMGAGICAIMVPWPWWILSAVPLAIFAGWNAAKLDDERVRR
jgi:hypothetical protein